MFPATLVSHYSTPVTEYHHTCTSSPCHQPHNPPLVNPTPTPPNDLSAVRSSGAPGNTTASHPQDSQNRLTQPAPFTTTASHTTDRDYNRQHLRRSDKATETEIMSTAARRRLMRDFKRMQTDPPAGVSASPIADNVMTWYASLFPAIK
jgi:hypothetical protein